MPYLPIASSFILSPIEMPRRTNATGKAGLLAFPALGPESVLPVFFVMTLDLVAY